MTCNFSLIQPPWGLRGMCMAAGNGIVAGTPFENIRAFLDETVKYGTEHMAKFA